MKAREELRLVERFDELRAGMIVVVKPCAWCGESHRAVLLRLVRRALITCLPGGEETEMDAWWIYPSMPCDDDELEGNVAEADIPSRTVFRVVDGLESDTTTTEQAPARRPRETVSR